MYTHRIIHIPAVGKAAELRKALEERNTSGNAHAPHSLRMNLFSPLAFSHVIRFNDLATLEAYSERPLDATYYAQSQQIIACLAQERIAFLYEELATTGRVAATPKFLVRNRQVPVAGKARELQAVLEERVYAARSGVIGARLERQVGSVTGPNFQVTLLFASLADMEKNFAANAADPSFPAFQAKVASLTSAPMQQRIQRIIAPFPSS
jgi:hypothetical protein